LGKLILHFWKLFLCLCWLLTLASAAWANDSVTTASGTSHVDSMLQLGYESYALPAGEKMGMLSAAYLLEIAPGLHFGPAVYGSIAGKRGGFFTVGTVVNWSQPIYSHFELQPGVFIGGGGGGPSMVGGGLMIRPYLDLVMRDSALSAGISISHVHFPSGIISSNQIGIVLAHEGEFTFSSVDNIRRETHMDERQGLGFDRASAVAGSYQTKQGAVSRSIGYAGARFDRFVMPGVFWGIETAGAASGNASGYAELLGTLGVEYELLEGPVSVGARFSAGMGGGSSALIHVGGGQLDKLSLNTAIRLSKYLHVVGEMGYAKTPTGSFSATFVSANVAFDLDHPYAGETAAIVSENEWVLGTEHYFKVRHKNGEMSTLNAVSLKENFYLGENLYVSGQARSAYGGESGGFAVGLIGLGYRTQKMLSGLYAGGEFLMGAAGGGFVDTSGGAVMQPIVYLGMDLAQSVGLKLSAGQIKSVKGSLNSYVFDLGINVSFGLAGR
jgi:hypothetical protein